MSKKTYKDTVEKVAAGLQMEEAGKSQAEIAQALGYKNAKSWQNMKYQHGDAARAMNQPVEVARKPHISESPHAVPKTPNTPAPSELVETLNAASKRVHAQVLKSLDGVVLQAKDTAVEAVPLQRDAISHQTDKAASHEEPEVSLILQITMRGQLLTFLSDGHSIGMRAVGSKEKFMRVDLADADLYIAEIQRAVQMAKARGWGDA